MHVAYEHLPVLPTLQGKTRGGSLSENNLVADEMLLFRPETPLDRGYVLRTSSGRISSIDHLPVPNADR